MDSEFFMSSAFWLPAFAIAFVLYVWLWVAGTDPLASDFVAGLWKFVKWTVIICSIVGIFLVITHRDYNERS